MILVVVDTNILVSALIRPQGIVGAVLDQLRMGAYAYLYSRPMLEELTDVLNRPRIRQKYHLSTTEIEQFLNFILLKGQVVTPLRRITACRDPKDDKFLEVAVAGKADVIVTGDKDLLVLHPFEDIPIINPREFLHMLGNP